MALIEKVVQDLFSSILKSGNTRFVRLIVNFLMSFYVLAALPWWTGEKGYKNLMSISDWCGLHQLSHGIHSVFTILHQEYTQGHILPLLLFCATLFITGIAVVILYAHMNVTNLLPSAVLTFSFILSMWIDISDWKYFTSIIGILVSVSVFICVYRWKFTAGKCCARLKDVLWQVLLAAFAFVCSYFYCIISPVFLLTDIGSIAGVVSSNNREN